MSAPPNAMAEVPVVILCGGRGVILDGQRGERINKALVRVQGKPLAWWVLLQYALHGAREFVLACGMQREELRASLAALSQEAPSADVLQLQLAGRTCRVRLVATPEAAMTGDRLLACKPLLAGAPRFAVTYSDTLSDVDLAAELAFHAGHGMKATLVGAQLPLRFRILGMRHDDHVVRRLSPKPVIESAPVNGGFYLFEQSIWAEGYLHEQQQPLVLEQQVLEGLAAETQLAAFLHGGLWQHLDCERELAGLELVVRRLGDAARQG